MILNKTRSSRKRYRIVSGNMGNFNDPQDSPLHKYHIAIGNQYSYGYRHCMAIDCFFFEENAPEEAKWNAVKFLLENGYAKWLKKKGLIV